MAEEEEERLTVVTMVTWDAGCRGAEIIDQSRQFKCSCSSLESESLCGLCHTVKIVGSNGTSERNDTKEGKEHKEPYLWKDPTPWL